MSKPLPSTLLTTHPYYPLDAHLPNYIPNTWSVPSLLGVFFGALVLLFTTTFFLSRRLQPSLSRAEHLTILWFVLSGSIHVFFEGYYVLHHATIAGEQHPIAQMWKEYAFSDSRYLTRNGLVLCLEGITMVAWGPGCFVVAALVVLRSAWRWPAQTVVSMGQLYGDMLYYATSFFDHHVLGITYSRPEAFYFWFYFVLMNAFWIVIPGYLIYQTAEETVRAVEVAERANASKKGR